MKNVIYIPKHTKSTDGNILRLLLPSFLGIVICMVCLAGATWAWFSASVQTAPQTIMAANYDIAVTVNGEPVDTDIALNDGTAYEITLTASGTAKEFGGYCIVQTGETKWYTTQLKHGDPPLTFTLIPETTADYTFIAVWGSYSGEADIRDGCSIGQKAETSPELENLETSQQPADNDKSTYIVQSGDSMWEIAQQYEGITADEIAAYNGIKNAAKIQIGQEIKIPPADYEIPESPVSPSTGPKADEPVSNESTDAESETTSSIAVPEEESSGAAEDNPSGDSSARK